MNDKMIEKMLSVAGYMTGVTLVCIADRVYQLDLVYEGHVFFVPFDAHTMCADRGGAVIRHRFKNLREFEKSFTIFQTPAQKKAARRLATLQN